MILVDVSQVMYSVILQYKPEDITIDLTRHMMLNMIRKNNVMFRKKFGNLVLAADGIGGSWRKTYFPNYKSTRREKREEEKEIWKNVHTVVKLFKKDLTHFFPYKLVEVEAAEADDIIATLTKYRTEPVVIISSDKDFIQLHADDVIQYDPIRDKYVKHESPREYLIEHILKGDRGDGVPNVLSADDVFVNKTRQVVMTKSRFDDFKSKMELNELSEDMKHNLNRNRTLIDFEYIPFELTSKIQKQFDESPQSDKSVLMNYFAAHDLKELFTKLGDF